jgi:hypothetical protein
MNRAARIASLAVFVLGGGYLSYAYGELNDNVPMPHLFVISILAIIGVYHISSQIIVAAVKRAVRKSKPSRSTRDSGS